MSDVWDKTTPVGSEAISNGDDRIREMKSALQIALQGQTTEGLEAVFPGTSAATAPVFRYRGLKDTTVNRPAAGQYGLFFDTTRQSLQRDNGSSYDDIGTNLPTGTVVPFYQASAPTGWTAVAVNDKFLRVVTAGGSGGSTGGTHAASTSLAHAHTVNSHTHSIANTHTHSLAAGSGSNFNPAGGTQIVIDGAGDIVTSGGAGVNPPTSATTGNGNAGETSGGSTPGTDTQFSGSFQYADIVLATKN